MKDQFVLSIYLRSRETHHYPHLGQLPLDYGWPEMGSRTLT